MAKVLSVLAVMIGVFLIAAALHDAYSELAAAAPFPSSRSARRP